MISQALQGHSIYFLTLESLLVAGAGGTTFLPRVSMTLASYWPQRV